MFKFSVLRPRQATKSSLDDEIKPAVYSHRYTVVETGAS